MSENPFIDFLNVQVDKDGYMYLSFERLDKYVIIQFDPHGERTERYRFNEETKAFDKFVPSYWNKNKRELREEAVRLYKITASVKDARFLGISETKFKQLTSPKKTIYRLCDKDDVVVKEITVDAKRRHPELIVSNKEVYGYDYDESSLSDIIYYKRIEDNETLWI